MGNILRKWKEAEVKTVKYSEKKYIIHILPRKLISEEIFDTEPAKNALIICADDTTEFNLFTPHQLVLCFQDTCNKNDPAAFSFEMAESIIRFIRELPEDVDDIYVCCAAGESRSPAIAAALLRISGRPDESVWKNPYYSPNTLVYCRILQKYGVSMKFGYMILRERQHKKAIRDLKDGVPCKYERWQILE